MNLTEAIKHRLESILAERKVSQYYVAKNGGIAKQTINNLITKNNINVTVRTIYQICATLNFTLEEFFADPIFNNLDD